MIDQQSSICLQMLRLCFLGIVAAILLAGGVHSSTARPLEVDEGDSQHVSVVNAEHNVITCRLRSPRGALIEFAPGDRTKSTTKYTIGEESEVIRCLLTINNVDKNDEGTWVFTYVHDGAGPANIENSDIIVNEIRVQDLTITSLSTINHFTRMDRIIDMSLDKRAHDEQCYVQAPNGVLTIFNDFKMEGVTLHSSSHFVSCRITVGPMNANLLGSWRVCGRPTGSRQTRCRPATIAWNNNTPDVAWSTTVRNLFYHPVHIGWVINPGVSGSGNVATCHVVTPNEEDLVLTNDIFYPNIERVGFNRNSLCTVNITADRTTVGDWTLYGQFRSGAQNMNEVRLPMRLFFYDENEPTNQAYNVTQLANSRRLAILGTRLSVNVTTSSRNDRVDQCQFRMPSGQMHTFVQNSSDPAPLKGMIFEVLVSPRGCRLNFTDITKDEVGQWEFFGKFSTNVFFERRQPFEIIIEDPANPIIDDFREIENLTDIVVTDREKGHTHRITIRTASNTVNEGCHILTPSGLQYAFIEGFNVPNVNRVTGSGIECGIDVQVNDLNMLGQWTLIARASRRTVPIERRQYFTLRIEELTSLENPITITEGSDLYLSLPEATSMYDTCKLYGPDNEEIKDTEVDPLHASSCGFIVRNVARNQRGTWALIYGKQVTYRTDVTVNVLESAEIVMDTVELTVGTAVNVTVGPHDAVYCKLEDTLQNIVFDGLGPCRIVLERVSMAHRGEWSMSVGILGTIMLREHSFLVDVLAVGSKPVVKASVARNSTSLILKCSVPIRNEVHACSFRDPSGKILIATHGVGEDGYVGPVVSYKSDTHNHDCTLRLLHPSTKQQGIWRCAVQTEHDISYSFLAITSSMLDLPRYTDSDPVLKSRHSVISAISGDAVSMLCSIEAAITYCYFRAPNGTIFNVGPAISSPNFEYVGNGFDAGECGMRFYSLREEPQPESGSWSCTVGLVDSEEEQRAYFQVSINDRVIITQAWHGGRLRLSLTVHGGSELKYCRFVRHYDGLSFTSNNVPNRYDFISNEMNNGNCELFISDPTHEDLEPWTVFTRVDGELEESFKTSTSPVPPPSPEYKPYKSMVGRILLWTFVGVGMLMIIIGVFLVPRKNREWTYRRASQLRNSLRKPPLKDNQSVPNTAMMY